MKTYLVKISSIFFLTILLASNIVNLHIYMHDEDSGHCTQKIEHSQNNDDNEGHNEAPCDLCLIAFNLNNLDFNNTLEFSFESLNIIQQITQKKVLGYTEILQNQLYLNKNRNKAPPYLV